MRKRILTATIFALLSLALLLNPTFAGKAQDTDSLEKKGRRQNHVRQEKTGEPPSG